MARYLWPWFSKMAVIDVIKNIYYKKRKKTIHCIGDSHTKAFEYATINYRWKKTRFKLLIVPGATALGLVNPNSKTDAFALYRNYIKTVPKHNTLLFCLGEVDCGFVIWYRAKKYKQSINEQFHQSLSNYKTFIDEIEKQGYKSIIILSTPLPTIIDGQEWGDIAKLRKEQLNRKDITASLKERTELTVQYNKELNIFCEMKGYSFLNIEADTLDRNTGVVKKTYRNSDPLDHHLDHNQISFLLIKQLRAIGFN